MSYFRRGFMSNFISREELANLLEEADKLNVYKVPENYMQYSYLDQAQHIFEGHIPFQLDKVLPTVEKERVLVKNRGGLSREELEGIIEKQYAILILELRYQVNGEELTVYMINYWDPDEKE